MKPKAKEFFRKQGYKLQSFMAGRYGVDSLWKALIVMYIIVVVLANIVYRFSRLSYYALTVMSLALLIYALFRAFSRNIDARRAENAQWLGLCGRAKAFFRLQSDKLKQRKTHKFVKCSECKRTLRLPRYKGQLMVTCPHCKNQFKVNTGKRKG